MPEVKLNKKQTVLPFADVPNGKLFVSTSGVLYLKSDVGTRAVTLLDGHFYVFTAFNETQLYRVLEAGESVTLTQ